MRPPIIGLTGKARCGKDTVANFLIAAIGGYRYAFADPIRDMLHAGLGIDMNSAYWKDHKEEAIPAFGVSPRQMMQTLGTEWGRDLVNKDLWLLLAKGKLFRTGPGMVVTDVRFENEADWIRKMGGRIIHVLRDDTPAVAAHSSEGGVARLNEDLVISNTGTIDELQHMVRLIAESFSD